MNVRAILAGLTVSLAAIGSSFAADMGPGPGSLKDVPYVQVPWSWNGFYGGLTLGYGSGSTTNYVSANDNAPHGYASLSPDGVIGGSTIGYNYQISPNWVIGAEADLSLADISATGNGLRIYDGHYWTGGWDGLFTLRGRVGYAMGRALFYGTAGYAALHSNELIAGNNANESDSGRGWRSGWVAGGGVEYAFTDRITGKIEYLHAGFEDLSGQTGFAGNYADQVYKLSSDVDIVRVGVNYKLW